MKKEQRHLGGHKFEMTQVDVETGNEIVLRLAQPAAALMSKAYGAKHAKPTKQDLIEGVVLALQALSPRDMRFIVRKLAAVTTVWLPDGKHAPKPWELSEHLNQVFAGHYDVELEWLRWGIEFNRFFGNVLARFSAREDGEASKSDSPTGSTGSSGDSSAHHAS